VKIDLYILKELFELREMNIKSKWKLRFFDTFKNVSESDLVFGWFASWHMVLPVIFARVMNKPIVIVTGGYDSANLKDIGYGNQRKWMSRLLTNWVLKKADVLICNSNFTKKEVTAINSNLQHKIRVIYHGVPEKKYDLSAKELTILNVGNVSRENLERKGILKFVKVAKLLPEYQFLQAGSWLDDSINDLKSAATSNIELLGYVSDETLTELYKKSKIYLQPSLHEGFGMSVAEAMMAGCIPVVTGFGALPEVTGKFAVVINSLTEEGIKKAIESTVEYPYALSEIQEHIKQNFPISKRKQLLSETLNEIFYKHHDVS
jgi:glycosyltransferase involved in cell wall biosynthesis